MRYRLKCLTPLLVGDGRKLSPIDYMVWKDQVNVLDQWRIFRILAKGPRLDSYLAQLKNGGIEMKKNKIRVKESSGNVFADLGFPNPEREQLKARLTLEIYRLIKDRGLTQAEAGAILGIKQPHVSGLMRGQSGNFSVERLMEFLTGLGQDVEITVRPTRKEHGGVSLVLA